MREMSENKEPDEIKSGVVTEFAARYGNKPAEQSSTNNTPQSMNNIVEGEKADGTGGRYLLEAHPLLKGNTNGIIGLHVDAAGIVTWINLSTGESVARTEPPAPKAYVFLLYPLLGFLIPWGAVRVLIWVGGGFFAPRQ